MCEFPDATFVVSSAEWAAAADAGSARMATCERQFDHAFDYRTLDFDGADASSFAGFGRAFDLFGDGSVRVASRPATRSATLSVILRLGRARRCWPATRSTSSAT